LEQQILRVSDLFIHVYSSKESISISAIASSFSFRPAFFVVFKDVEWILGWTTFPLEIYGAQQVSTSRDAVAHKPINHYARPNHFQAFD
jgi:hypothetical protein